MHIDQLELHQGRAPSTLPQRLRSEYAFDLRAEINSYIARLAKSHLHHSTLI